MGKSSIVWQKVTAVCWGYLVFPSLGFCSLGNESRYSVSKIKSPELLNINDVENSSGKVRKYNYFIVVVKKSSDYYDSFKPEILEITLKNQEDINNNLFKLFALFECFCLEQSERLCINCSKKGPDYLEKLQPPGYIHISYHPNASNLSYDYSVGDQIFQGILYSNWPDYKKTLNTNVIVKIGHISAEPRA